MLLDRMQRFQAARARKPQVEQHGVSTRAVEQPVGMFGRLRHLRVESKRQRHLAAGLADSAVVVHDQEVQEIRSLELRRMAMALTMTKDGGGRCGKHGGKNDVSYQGIALRCCFFEINRPFRGWVAGFTIAELQSHVLSEPFRKMACEPTQPRPLRSPPPVRPAHARSRIST